MIVTAAAVCALSAPLYGCAPEGEETSKYTIEATYDGGNKLTGSVKLSFYNNTDNALNSLKFNLWGNAYREGALSSPISDATTAQAYYDGRSYGQMEIVGADGGEWQVCGDDRNILEITLPSAIYPDERTEVSIDYELTLANVNHRTGVAERSVNLGNFYPILCAYGQSGWLEYTYCPTGDPFVSDVADYSVELTIPQDYTAAASGALKERTEGNGQAICRYELSCARDFAIVLSREFEVLSRDAGGVNVSYYFYDDDSAQDCLDAAAESLEYFANTFGDYPYPTLSVVQTGFCQGGMEYPALTMISDACDRTTAIYTIVHENAHQWWYAAVGSDGYAHSWQDEGLAEYSTLMFFENAPVYGFTKTGLLGSATKAYRAYFSVYNQLFEGTDTKMERALDEFSGDYEYANIAYNKALLMFDAVRSACGDDDFVSALKEYFDEYTGRIAPPEGLIAAFCRRADCEGLFDSFLEGKVII